MGFYLQGLTVGLAYVAPIGMQNLFVINSALTKTRRRALMTALIVIMFDIVLSLACFFGIGALMQRYAWLQLGVLAVGGVVVIRIGAGLLWPKLFERGTKDGGRTGTGTDSAEARRERQVGEATGNDASLMKTVTTACVVTWFNPQAIIDGTLMLGAFSATLTAAQSSPFIIGVETASIVWFIGVTLLISAFSHKFSPKVITRLNQICGVIIVAYGIKLLIDFAMAVL